MPIYHLSTKPVSRESGRTATASAAYRAAEKILDLRSGQVWDFTRRSGVEHAEIVLPASAQGDTHWALDRPALWNAAEMAEKRKDARTAREYELALPHEFTRAQQIDLTRRFAGELAERYHVAVDFAIHEPHWHGDRRNVHAHLLTTTREITTAGLTAKSSFEWSDTARFKKGLGSTKKELKAVRKFWADIQNERFKELGLDIRVDHRTLKEQGIEREPTTHLGPAVSGLKRRGLASEVAQRIREQQRLAAQARIERLAEIRQLERERREVEQSILDVSGDLAAAQRDLVVHRPSLSLEDIRRQAREEWQALRAERLAQEPSPASGMSTENTPPLKPDSIQTIEERQQKAAERWLESRRSQELERGQGKELGQEKDKDIDRTKERDHGVDDDFGL